VRHLFAGHSLVVAVLAGSIAVWALLELWRGLSRRPEATAHDRGSLFVVQLSVLGGALLAATALNVTAASFAFSPLLFGVSLAAIWAGIALRWWSFRSLGRYFTFTVMTSLDQPVITSGPYRWLRHPSYAGILLIIAGIGLAYGNWLSLTALVGALLVGLVYRIRIEESALASELGSAYTTYASSRKRLIPFVW
jgi:protein-S-isoprenylcysteine O-methyltransferase Ste14